MFERIANSLTRFMYAFWPIVLVAFIVGSVFSLKPTAYLFKNISTDPIDLLPKNHPNVKTLLQIKNKLERGVRSSFVIESDDRNANIRFMHDLANKLRADPQISRVEEKKVGYDYFNKNKLLFLELNDLRTIRDRIEHKIRKEKLMGLLIDLEDEREEFSFKDLQEKYKSNYADGASSPYNESTNGKIFSMTVESRSRDTGLASASQFQDLLIKYKNEARPTDYHPSMKLYLSGATKVYEYRTLMSDLTRIGIIAGILIFLPLLFRFRNPLHVLWIFFPLLVGLPISFWASSLFVDKLNICTSFLFAILGGLGIENGIHIFSRYSESRSAGDTQRKAITEIFSHTGRAILTAVASVAVTFLSLIWNDFRGFSEFGLISGVGLWVIFGVYFLFMPALLLLLEKTKLLRFSKINETKTESSILPSWLLTSSLVVGVLFSFFSLIALTLTQFEYDSKKVRAEIPEMIEAQMKRTQTVKRVNAPAVAIIHSEEEAEILNEAIKKAKLEDPMSSTIDTSRSYYDLLPKQQNEKMRVIRQIKKLLDDKTFRFVKGENKKHIDDFRKVIDQTAPVSSADLPEDLLYLFKGKPATPGELLYINAIPRLSLDDGKNAMEFAHDIARVETKIGTFYPSSDAVIYGKVLETMLADTPRVMLLSFLLVLFFVYVDFKNIKKACIVMSSILFGVLWMFGVMWLMGVKLNFYNLIIIPAVLGMSIDNSIHIFHRYQELGFGSIPRVLATSGKAALIASCTNASAFIGLLFCMHKGLFSIGLLAAIGVGTCLLSTLIFFPAMLDFFEKVRLNRKKVLP